jgi:hypothetical protein
LKEDEQFVAERFWGL